MTPDLQLLLSLAVALGLVGAVGAWLELRR